MWYLVVTVNPRVVDLIPVFLTTDNSHKKCRQNLLRRPSNNNKNSVWKAGAKGFNKVASAASQVAKSATPGGFSSSSRRKMNEEQQVVDGTSTIHDDNNSSIDTPTTTTTSDTSGKEKKGMFKKTLKSFNKAANKVNPLRIPNAMMKSGGTKSHDNEEHDITRDLGTDEAEDAVLSSVEKRSRNTVAGEDGFRPAVEGESPPFGVPTLGNAFTRAFANSKSGGGEKNADGTTKRTSPSLKMMTQQVMAMQRLERAAMMHKQASVTQFGERKVHHHRRARTLLDTIGSVEEEKKESEPDAFGLNEADHFRTFDKVFNEDVSSHDDERQRRACQWWFEQRRWTFWTR